MNMLTSKKAAMAEFYKYYDKAKSLHDGAFEVLFVSGEILAQVKELCADTDEFVDCLETYNHVGNPIKISQANNCIRIATHKHQCRVLLADGTATTINELCKLIPKTNEPPVVTEADPAKLGYVGTVPGTKANNADDWHTPQEFSDAARQVMGSIDLDPFSSVSANQNIKAVRIFTEADNGLGKEWSSPDTRTVWMNPPYSKGASAKAVEKFLEQYDVGAFDQAIVLMNSSTDTNWWHRMVDVANAVCFTKGRISFEGAGGKKKAGNTKGQVFFYFGRKAKTFKRVFSEHGKVLMTENV